MHRRAWMLAAGTGIVGGAASLRGQSTFGVSRTPSLRTRLETGLRARRPQEFAFIDLVVDLVNLRVLPRRIVDVSFLWARRRADERGVRYPMPYFQFAVTTLASRAKIRLQRPPKPDDE